VRPPAFGQWPVLGQFPLRLVGCMPDTTSAAQATGRPYSQAEQLLGGGDFLAIAAGVFVHFQAASLDPYEWTFCLEQLGQSLAGSPVANSEPTVAAQPKANSRAVAMPLAVRLG
jgi:hypothetical protein